MRSTLRAMVFSLSGRLFGAGWMLCHSFSPIRLGSSHFSASRCAELWQASCGVCLRLAVHFCTRWLGILESHLSFRSLWKLRLRGWVRGVRWLPCFHASIRFALSQLAGLEAFDSGYLVDPASSHMLVSKIKPCMSKYKRLVL